MRFFHAIITHYYSPSNRHGAKIKATANSGIVVDYDHDYNHDLTPSDNHAIAAFRLATKFGWLTKDVQLHGGLLSNEGSKKSYVFTLCDTLSKVWYDVPNDENLALILQKDKP